MVTVSERLKCGADGRRVRNARPLCPWVHPTSPFGIDTHLVQKGCSAFHVWKTRTFHGKDSTKKSSNSLHHVVVLPDGSHYSMIGSETTGLHSLRQCISVSHRGLCGAGVTTCTVGTSSVRRIRHTRVIISRHSSSHKK
jgi:hypothetical protein